MSDSTFQALDPLMAQLLAFDQGQLTRGALTLWCRKPVEVPACARPMLAFLADSTPERARQLRQQAGLLRDWIGRAPLAQAKVLQRICGSFVLAGAIQLQRDGQIGDAEALLQLSLELAPERSAAWLLMAQLQIQLAQPSAALETLRQALLHFPQDLALLSLQAQLLLQLGLGHQALASFEVVVTKLPDQPDAWLGLGNLRQALGNPEGALEAYQRALQLAPDHAGLLNNLGQLQHRRLAYAEAETAYRRALERDPRLVEAWNNLAALELDRGHLLEAAAAVAQAMALAPDYAPVWLNAGISEGLSGRSGKALAAFARARQLDPLQEQAWLEEACLLLRSQQTEQAAQTLQAALRQLPHAADLLWLHSRVLAYRFQAAPAREAGQKALERAPDDFRQLQLELGWSLSRFLDHPADQANWLAQLAETLERWSGRRFGLRQLLPEMRFLPELLWGLNYVGDGSHLALRRAYAGLFELDIAQLPAAAAIPLGSGVRRPRLGVLVSPGHEGVFRASNPGLSLLRRLPERFEVVLLGHPLRLAESGLPVIPLPDHLPAAVEAVRAARLDLLYFWEVGTDTLNYFLAFFRLAPVQFSSWAVPLTSGVATMDYYLSSRWVEAPEAAAHFSEKLLLADALPLYCGFPRQIGRASRAELGLPEGKLYLCLQTPLKFSQHFLLTLQQILDADPDAWLVLVASEQAWIQQRVEQYLRQRGLLRGRVQWLQPPMAYAHFLNLIAQADVVLDTRECSGGQTADDALMLGVPVVSFPGETTRSRLTAGRLRLLELDEGLVTSWPQYAERAVALAHAGPLRTAALDKLARHHARLVENPAGPAAFAELLEHMLDAAHF